MFRWLCLPAFLVALLRYTAVLGEYECSLLQSARLVFEDEVGVEAASFEYGFKV